MSPKPRRTSAAVVQFRPTPLPSLVSEGADQLLAVASSLMAQQGFHHTSMRDVARSASYSLAGIYHYFSSKEDLLFQIQERVFTSLLEEQESAVREAGATEEQLEALVRGHVAFYARHAAALKVCAFELESLTGTAYRRVEELRHRYYRLMAGAVRAHLGVAGRTDETAVRHMTLFVFGMINWMCMWFDPERDKPVERLADEMVRLILHGLGGRPRAAERSRQPRPAGVREG